MITRTDIQEAVDRWAETLQLNHWAIDIKWDKPTPDDMYAKVSMEDWYDEASLHFHPEFAKWDEEKLNITVSHELLHLVLRDLAAAASSMAAQLGEPAKALANDRFEHEMEGVIERVARILVQMEG